MEKGAYIGSPSSGTIIYMVLALLIPPNMTGAVIVALFCVLPFLVPFTKQAEDKMI